MQKHPNATELPLDQASRKPVPWIPRPQLQPSTTMDGSSDFLNAAIPSDFGSKGMKELRLTYRVYYALPTVWVRRRLTPKLLHCTSSDVRSHPNILSPPSRPPPSIHRSS
ncbi:MAG: hypothetical protein ACKN9U_26385 [Pirellulaceae bacterium]